MPIHLITGKGGAGKTLYTLTYLIDYLEKDTKERAAQGLDPRPVYYHGIPELKLPWFPLEDPKKWYELPKGAVIVVDEIQKHWPNRPNGSINPKYAEELTTARHSGYDIFAITQDPALVDIILRKMANKHFHCVRRFGGERCMVLEWESTKTDPHAKQNLRDAIRHDFKYPKRIYELYKSADVHTFKKKIPMRLWFLRALPLILIAAGFVAYHYLTKATDQSTKPQEPQNNGIYDPVSVSPGQTGDRVKTRDEYISDFQPRLQGLAYTAPRYDKVTEPKTAPFPDACIESSRGCKCYTNQATQLDVSLEMCRQIVAHGYFKDFEDSTSKAPPRSVQAAAVVTPYPVASGVQSMPFKATGFEAGSVPFENRDKS